jgi:hypothetical protein
MRSMFLALRSFEKLMQVQRVIMIITIIKIFVRIIYFPINLFMSFVLAKNVPAQRWLFS